MSISVTISPPKLSLRYAVTRNRQQAYNLLVREFKRSGLTQAEFAKRAKKGTDLISRYLSRPRNLTLDTLGELLFALTGGALSFSISYPAQRASVSESIRPHLQDVVQPVTTAGREPLQRTVTQRGSIRFEESEAFSEAA